MLEANHFDFVELSGGTYQSLSFKHRRESTKKREAFFLEFADMIAPVLHKTKTFVTGGFLTAGGMAQALQSVDGIGLARPSCQEPDLPKRILSGRVKGAIKQRLPYDNFGLTNMAAGTQIRQLGKDEEPIDLSKKENEEAFMKDMEKWSKNMADDKEMAHYGYIDISSAPSVPYGSSSASL